MDIWIIQNGEKKGPLPDYHIREKIETGELDASTPAWHEKLEGWKTLGDIDLFHQSLNPPKPEPSTSSPEKTNGPADTAKHKPYLIRRFWARWLDLYLYSGIWWFAMWLAGRDIGMLLGQPWIMLFHYLPWFALEAFLIHRFATTPGKWLLNLKVLNLDGSHLSLAASTLRSARVLLMGIGFGVQGLVILCQALGWFATKNLGSPLWDRAGGHFLDGTPIKQSRLTFYILTFMCSLWLQMIVVAPYVMETAMKSFPDQREMLEKNPPWHLPKRH